MPSNFSIGISMNGSIPYALPNGTEPLIVLDFKNGVYMANGDTVAVGDLLTEDADYGTWNPADIVSGTGLAPSSANSSPVFTGDALALVLSGATVVTILSYAGAAANKSFRYEMTDNFIDYGLYYHGSVRINVSDPETMLSLVGDETNEDTEAALASGRHGASLTFTDGKISQSTDGNPIITINPAVSWSPAPGAMGFVVPTGYVVEYIGIYPAQEDADLPMLSTL